MLCCRRLFTVGDALELAGYADAAAVAGSVLCAPLTRTFHVGQSLLFLVNDPFEDRPVELGQPRGLQEGPELFERDPARSQE